MQLLWFTDAPLIMLWRACNPTWSHTAFLSWFHARCRSSFWLHNWLSRLLGGALWRACNPTSFSPYLTGPVDYPFASRHKRIGFKSPGGYFCETGISLLALSHYSSQNSHKHIFPCVCGLFLCWCWQFFIILRQKNFLLGELSSKGNKKRLQGCKHLLFLARKLAIQHFWSLDDEKSYHQHRGELNTQEKS